MADLLARPDFAPLARTLGELGSGTAALQGEVGGLVAEARRQAGL